jgi:N-methylhydantoinase A
MARALRRVSVERGIDPRGCPLIAFGGGGPLHACGLAEQLGMTRVLVPPYAGVLSALGLAVAPPRRVSYSSVMHAVEQLEGDTLSALAASLSARASDAESTSVAERWTTEYILRARYTGQGHELEIPFEGHDSSSVLARRFAAAHQSRYGFVLDLPVEAVSARCVRTGEAPQVELTRRGTSRWNNDSKVDDGSVCEAVVRGRAVIALSDATLLVAEGWTARALPIGGWLLERDA